MKNLWNCPVCQTQHFSPIMTCTNCGCHLLLLAKVKLESEKLALKGALVEAQALYQPQLAPTDINEQPSSSNMP